MKRTAATFALLAGFGGGCVSPSANPNAGMYQQGTTIQAEQPAKFGGVTRGKQVDGLQGPTGEPVVAMRGAMPSDNNVQQAAMFRKYGTPVADRSTVALVPGMNNSLAWSANANSKVVQANFASGCGPAGCGPSGPPMPYDGRGILPVPAQGVPGAVAAVGALVPGRGYPGGLGAATGAIPNGRASIKFTSPAGMKVTWQLPTGDFNSEATGLTVPKEYNFMQGQVYRLRLTQILPNHPGKAFYPTLEVAAANPKTLQFLAHSSVPITFTNDDFDHAVSGNLVVKVVYLPDRDNQDFLALAGGLEEVNSTRLEPGVDPVAEAQRKGSVLAIIRLGNIDLENRVSPAMTAPPPGGPMPYGPGGGGGMMLPPPTPGPMGGLPPGSSNVGGPIAPSGPAPGVGPRIGNPVPPSSPTPPLPAAPVGPVAPGRLPPGVSNDGPPIALPPIK